MAQQNQTSVQIVVDVKNRQQLEQLKKTVNELAKSTNQGSLDLSEYVEKIKDVVKSSGNSISTLKAQINLWEKIRTNVSGTSEAYAVASSEIRRLNADLQKISRSYTYVSDVANKASRSMGAMQSATMRYLGVPNRAVAPTVQEVIAGQGAPNLTPSAASRAYLGRPAPVDATAVQAQQKLTDLAREQFGITGLSQNLQRQKTKLAQDEAAANASTVEYMRAQNRERMSAMRTQALGDIGGRLAPNVGGPLALPAYTERGLQQLTGGLNLAPNALELSRARRSTRVAQLRLQRQRAQERGQLAENIGLGVGFPALFGAGPGSIIGGGLGSFLGTGFAGQIVGGAIGQKFDDLVQSTRDFAKSLREGGDAAGYLEQSLGYLNPETSNLILNLQKSGQTAKAAELALREYGKVIGKENAKQLQQGGEAADQFFRGAIIGFNKLTAGVIGYISKLKEARLVLGPGQSIDLKGLFGEVSKQAPKINEDRLSQAAKDRVASLRDQNALLEAQGRGARYILGTNAEQYGIAQKNIALTEKIVNYNDIILRQKRGEISIEEKIQLVKKNNLEYDKKVIEINRQTKEQDIRNQVRQFNAYAETLQVNDQMNQVNRNIADYSRTELQNAQERVSELAKIELRERFILEAKYTAAILDARLNGTVRETNNLYASQFELLKQQQKERRLQRQESELQLRLQKELERTQAKQQRAQIKLGFAGEIAGLRGGLAIQAKDQLGFAQQQLRAEQKSRYIQEIAGPELELAKMRNALQEAINAKNITYANSLRTQINDKQALVNISKQELGTVFQLQEQQLLLNEHARQFDGVYQSIGSGLTNTFDLLIQGTEEWGSSLQNIAATVLQDIARQLIQIFIIEKSIGFMRRIFAPAAPAATVPDVLASFNQGVSQYGFSMGGIMTQQGPLKLKRYAAGGIATGPQLAMYGEGSRPEAYVPLPDGRSIPVTMKSGGVGNVVVNVDANGSNVEGNGQQANALGKAIGIAVQQELIKQKRPGGLLA